MVDNVIVSGLGPGISSWASESTTKEILKTLQKSLNLSAEQLKQLQKCCPGGNAGSKGAQSDIYDTINAFGEGTKKNTETVKDSTKEVGKLGAASKAASNSLLGLATGAIGMLTGALVNQLGTIRELNNSGMNLLSDTQGISSGLGAFTDAAVTANLSFKELAELQKKYGNTLNIYGVQSFSRAAKSFNANIDNFGDTATEGAEFLASYLESQRTLGIAQAFDVQRQAAAAEELYRSMDSLSKVTGQSKQQMLDNIQAGIQQNTQTRFFLATATEDVKNSYMKFAGMFAPGQSNLKENITELITDPFSARSPLWQALTSTVGGATGELENMKNKLRSGTDITDRDLDKFLGTFKNVNKGMLESMSVNGDATAKMAAQSVLDMMEMANNRVAQKNLDKLSASEQKKQLIAQVTAAANFTDAWKHISTFLERTMGTLMEAPGFAESIAKFASSFATALARFVPSIVNLLGKMAPLLVPVVDGLTFLVNGLAQVLGSFTDIIGDVDAEKIGDTITGKMIKIATIGIAGFFAAKTLKNMFSFGGGGNNNNNNNNTGGGIGKGIGNIGTGIGTGLGGLLKGVAAGIGAFGNPTVAFGAVVFAGAILAIGAALAGSAWLLGKALPTLAGGFQAFEDLTPEKLSAVGSSLIDLSGGIVAFAGAGVLSAFTSLGTLFTKITGGGIDDLVITLDKLSSISGSSLTTLGSSLTTLGPSLQSFAEAMSGDFDVDNDAISDFADSMIDLLNKLSDVDTSKITIFGQLAFDIKELTSSIISLQDVGAISVDSNNTVKIAEKPVVQLDNITAPATMGGAKNTALASTSPNPEKAEKLKEISTMQELDIMKKQLRFLANIAANMELQVKYSKRAADPEGTTDLNMWK